MKAKLEQLPCEHFLQAFEIYHALLRAKQVGEKRAKIQNPVTFAHKAVVLTKDPYSLYHLKVKVNMDLYGH